MRALTWSALVIALGGLAGLAWQRRATQAMRAELADRHRAQAEAQQLVAERQRLDAVQIPPADLAARREERAALSKLLVEVEGMRRRAKPEKAASSAVVAAGAPAAAGPSLKQEEVAAELWANRGTQAPDAAFETALWAAAGGDVETLGGLLFLDDAARIRAADLFARLPPPLRRELGAPQNLVAMLTATAIPLGSARILTQDDETGVSRLGVQLRDTAGSAREVRLTLRAESGRWRLVVPAEAVERFGDQLRSPSVALKPTVVPAGS